MELGTLVEQLLQMMRTHGTHVRVMAEYHDITSPVYIPADPTDGPVAPYINIGQEH